MGTFLVKSGPDSPVFGGNVIPFSGSDFSPIWREEETFGGCAHGPYTIPEGEKWMQFGFRPPSSCVIFKLGSVYTITRNFNTGVMYLDGDTEPVGIGVGGGIPTGFLVTGSNGIAGSAKFISGIQVELGTSAIDNISYVLDCLFQISQLSGNIKGGDHVSEFNSFIPGPNNSSFPSPSVYDILGLGRFSVTLTQLVNLSEGGSGDERYIKYLYDKSLVFPYSGYTGACFTGDYTLWSTQLALNTENASVGDTITITDGNGGLGSITAIKLGPNATSATIISQSANSLSFIVPSGIGIFGVVGIVGTLTDESVYLGAFNLSGLVFSGAARILLLQDVSGIYSIVPNKRSDTFYDRTTSPVSEVEVKIQDPFWKTGFIPPNKK